MIQSDRYNWVPPLDADDAEILKFVKRVINPDSRFRRWHMQRMAQNVWAYRGRMWIEPLDRLAPSGAGNYAFREVYRRGSAAFRRPVDNKIGPGVDNETARLGRKEYEADTRPVRDEPEFRAAARTARNVLLYDLERQMWPEQREDLYFDIVATGTCSLQSYWDQTAEDLTPIASPDAAGCPGCGLRLASRKVPMQSLDLMHQARGMMHLEHAEMMVSDQAPSMALRLCPQCEEPTELVGYEPGPDEIQQEDVFGRPFGIMVHRGDAMFRVIPPTALYPENGGINTSPQSAKIWGVKEVKPLEWIFQRLSEDVCAEIAPENPRELMRDHITLGDEAFTGSGYTPTDPDIYYNHAAYLEVHVDPIGLPGLEAGVSYCVVGDKVVYKQPLEVEVETPDGDVKKVKRYEHSAARYKRVRGEFWGRTPVDDALPLNRRLNELDAQMIDIRERGVPMIAAPVGTEIYVRPSNTGSMNVVSYETVDPGWNLRDSIVNAQPLTGNNYLQERDRIEAAIRDVLGPQPVEAGAPQKNIRTATELQIQAEESNVKRAPAERSLSSMFKRIFGHHLDITAAFRREEDAYEVKDEAGRYSREAYSGVDLIGGTTVEVEVRGTVDATLYQAQATQQAITMGLYDITDPVARDQALDQMNLPKGNQSQSVQVTRANQAWFEFEREWKIPVIDPTIHDAFVRFQVLGRRWQGDVAQERQEAVGWDAEVVPLLSGWERQYKIAGDRDMQQRAVYEGYPPQEWPAIFSRAQALAQQARNARVPEAQIPKIPPPPQGGFLPEYLPQRILLLWYSMLGKDPAVVARLNALPPETLEANPKLQRLWQQCRTLEMYAVIQAYRLMMPPPPMAAPPGPGAQAQAAPGDAGMETAVPA